MCHNPNYYVSLIINWIFISFIHYITILWRSLRVSPVHFSRFLFLSFFFSHSTFHYNSSSYNDVLFFAFIPFFPLSYVSLIFLSLFSLFYFPHRLVHHFFNSIIRPISEYHPSLIFILSFHSFIIILLTFTFPYFHPIQIIFFSFL